LPVRSPIRDPYAHNPLMVRAIYVLQERELKAGAVPVKQQEGLKPIRSREQVQLIHFLEKTDQEFRSYRATVCVGHNARHLFPPKQAGWPIRIYFTRASIIGNEIRVFFIWFINF